MQYCKFNMQISPLYITFLHEGISLYVVDFFHNYKDHIK